MPVKYRIASCTNPAGAAGTDYACCKAVSEKDFSDADIVKCINTNTSYTHADIVGVVSALKEKLLDYMLAGIHVDLKDDVTNLGIMQPAISAACFPKSQISDPAFDPRSKIKEVHPHLRISNELQQKFQLEAKFKRIPSTLMP